MQRLTLSHNAEVEPHGELEEWRTGSQQGTAKTRPGLKGFAERPKAEDEERMMRLRVWSMFYIANAWPICEHVSTNVICMRVGQCL